MTTKENRRAVEVILIVTRAYVKVVAVYVSRNVCGHHARRCL